MLRTWQLHRSLVEQLISADDFLIFKVLLRMAYQSYDDDSEKHRNILSAQCNSTAGQNNSSRKKLNIRTNGKYAMMVKRNAELNRELLAQDCLAVLRCGVWELSVVTFDSSPALSLVCDSGK
eukprot:1223497-Amphidinium_carterae.1